MSAPPADHEMDHFLAQYEQDVARLVQLEDEIRTIEPEAPELVRGDLFRTPDRLADAEALLANVRERNRPLPGPPEGLSFDSLAGDTESFALRAARSVADQPGDKYNPFLVYDGEGYGKSAVIAALANALAEQQPTRPVAYLDGQQFASELIDAIEQNCVESWRARYRAASAFVLDDIEGLIGTERAQEELFHLFELLKRAGVQLVFGSTTAPGLLLELDERLRTRLESGLVVAIDEESTPSEEQPVPAGGEAALVNGRELAVEVISTEGESPIDDWFLSREKVMWKWPYLEDWLIEELE